MIETRIQGIPCQVEMVSGTYIKPWVGSPHNCPSDVDYYGGWEDVDFCVYDSRGKRAKWLERKMTEEDVERIIDLLIESVSQEPDYDEGDF
jgi:hypothetical protein